MNVVAGATVSLLRPAAAPLHSTPVQSALLITSGLYFLYFIPPHILPELLLLAVQPTFWLAGHKPQRVVEEKEIQVLRRSKYIQEPVNKSIYINLCTYRYTTEKLCGEL